MDSIEIISHRLGYPLNASTTIGQKIEQRGIPISYILELSPHHPVPSMLNYINSLVDKAGCSKDEYDDANSHAVS